MHTNEITVLLGDNFFVERSAKQATAIAERRIGDVSTKVNLAKKELERMLTRKKMTGMLQDEVPDDGSKHGLFAQADGTFDIREPLSDDTATDEDDVDDEEYSATWTNPQHASESDANNTDTHQSNFGRGSEGDSKSAIAGAKFQVTDTTLHVPDEQSSANSIGLDFKDRPNINKAPQRWLHLDHSDTLFQNDDHSFNAAHNRVKKEEEIIPKKTAQEARSNLSRFLERLDELEQLESESDPAVACADPIEDGVEHSSANDNELCADDPSSQEDPMQIFLGTEEEMLPKVSNIVPSTDIRISHTQEPSSAPKAQACPPQRANPAGSGSAKPIKTPGDIYSHYGTSQDGDYGATPATAVTKSKHVRFAPAVAPAGAAPASTPHSLDRDNGPAAGVAVGDIVERGMHSQQRDGHIDGQMDDDAAEHEADVRERQADIAAIQGLLADKYMVERGGRRDGLTAAHGHAPAAPKMSLFMQRRLGLQEDPVSTHTLT